MAPGIGGEAAFQVRVAGRPGARCVRDNRLERRQHHRAGLLALAGLSGPLTLEAGVLDTRGLRGQLNGGDLTIEGAVPVRAGTVAPRPLNVEARGLFVEVPGACAVSSTRASHGRTPRRGHGCPVRSRSPRTAIGNRSLRLRPRSPPSRLPCATAAGGALDCGHGPRHPPQLSRSHRRRSERAECRTRTRRARHGHGWPPGARRAGDDPGRRTDSRGRALVSTDGESARVFASGGASAAPEPHRRDARQPHWSPCGWSDQPTRLKRTSRPIPR